MAYPALAEKGVKPVFDEMIEQKLRVKVIGRWFDLGYGTVFTTEKQLNVPEDMEGMKMRVPGG